MFKKFLKTIFAHTGYTIAKLDNESNPQREKQITPQHFFDLYFSAISPHDFFFVQIGANDGVSRDPLHDYVLEYQLAGVVVEPQKEIFKKLEETYAGYPLITCANVAIAKKSGTLPFYRVKESLLNERNYFEATAIASFDKETFRKTLKKRIPRLIEHISDNLDDYTEEISVDALSFQDFTKRYAITKIDFLFLDCEGYDYEILKMVDFKKFSPKIINFESKFLSDADRSACEALLLSEGYQVFRHGNDTCAFK